LSQLALMKVRCN